MNTGRLRWCLPVALLASGCSAATPPWTRAQTSFEQFTADRNQCLAASRRYLSTGEAWTDYDVLDRCMLMKGYTASARR